MTKAALRLVSPTNEKRTVITPKRLANAEPNHPPTFKHRWEIGASLFSPQPANAFAARFGQGNVVLTFVYDEPSALHS